jgi:methylenetetrahydrofolate dehydrogenase (NADP+)/methenyltetrahydrofolate cyclohydrolase
MAAAMMDGKALAERIRSEVAEEVRALGGVGLATVLAGDDAGSEIYIRRKHEAAESAGFRSNDVRLPATITEAELLEVVAGLNADDSIDALLVQLPLPDGIDEERIIRAVDPDKDVDGFHPLNVGELVLARPRLVPATARGVMALLSEYRIELDGARATIVGRSEIVGKPIAQLLEQANATVTLCHSHTRDLARHTLAAEVLVVAPVPPSSTSASTGPTPASSATSIRVPRTWPRT